MENCRRRRPTLPAPSILLVLLCLHSLRANALKCPRSFKLNSETVTMAHCNPVDPDSRATLSWTYNAQNGSVNIAFKAAPSTKRGWVAWGINPNAAAGVVGAQALVAYRQSNGTMFTGTYTVNSDDTLVSSQLSFRVIDFSSEYRHGTVTLFATLFLPSNMIIVNQVWQVGSTVEGENAFVISDVNNFATINLITSKMSVSPVPAPAPATATAPITISPSLSPSPSTSTSPSLSSSSAPSPTTGTSKAIHGRPTISLILATLFISISLHNLSGTTIF